MRHQKADFGGREKLPGTLAGTFGKLAQQVFIGTPEKIGLYVGQAETIARIGKSLDDGGKFGRIDIAFAIAFGGKVDEVDDTGQGRVVTHDGTHRLGEVFADIAGFCALLVFIGWPVVAFSPAEDRPTCLWRQVKANQMMIAFYDLQREGLIAVIIFGHTLDFHRRIRLKGA